MPEIVDNIKVGQFIKDQLKEQKISQDALAQKLNITRNAVSANLNGKSSFSRKNLEVISEMLNMKVEDILSCQKSEFEEYACEFQKLARRGLSEFKRNFAKDVVISEPDIFGKVLVDYLIDEDIEEIFIYLHDSEVEFVKNHFHRAKDIYLKVIAYVLKKNLPGAIRYIKAFSDLNSCFDISLYNNSTEIWNMINTEANRYLIQEMMELKITQEYKVLGFKTKKIVKAITKNLWLEIIAKYKPLHVLNVYLEYYANPEDFYSFTKVMIKGDYAKAIEAFVKKFFTEEQSNNKRSGYNFQKAINLIIENDNFALFKKFVSAKIYENLTEIIVKNIQNNQKNYFDYALGIQKANLDIDYVKIGLIAVKFSSLEILDSVIMYLEQKELNLLLSEVINDDTLVMKYLVDHGAKFDFDYYNSHTMKNVNLLIELLNKKEGE
ncbi:MAG: helix-turn-helix transcriptional regulator [Candidatus Izemoplasmatales bacterium]